MSTHISARKAVKRHRRWEGVNMAWQPQRESLQQLAYSLRDSLSGYDRARQKQAEEVRAIYAFFKQTPLQICAE